MARQRGWLLTSSAALCFTSLFAGCGSGTTSSPVSGASATPAPTTGTTPVAANLNGNWLLTGTLPLTSVSGMPLNTSFGAAVTISAVDKELIATFDRNESCMNSVASGPIGVISGAVASDGSFTLTTTSTILSDTATVTGTVPATATTSWAGHLDLIDHTTFCAASQMQNFTALRIADVTGTYSGTATLNGTVAGKLQPPQTAVFTFTLQQGNTAPGTTSFNASLLSGVVAVQGTTCFASGTLPLPVVSPSGALTPTSGVLGAEIEFQATMNDGATIAMIGHMMDTSSTNIYVDRILGDGGTCGAFSAAPFMLTRQ